MYRRGTRLKDEMWIERWSPVLEAYGNGEMKNTPHRKYRYFEEWLSKIDVFFVLRVMHMTPSYLTLTKTPYLQVM